MKIVRSKSTYQVFYQFDDDADIRLDHYGMWGEVRALDMKAETHEIVENVERLKEEWSLQSMMYDTDWSIYDQSLYDTLEGSQIQKEIEIKCDMIFNIRLQKTYTDIKATFPDGDAYIQFRNDFDRTNFGDVASGAQAIAAQDPTAMMYYRTADNVTHPISAGEFVALAVNVLIEKQEIVYASWVHKDSLRDLTTLEGVRAHDVYSGWPV